MKAKQKYLLTGALLIVAGIIVIVLNARVFGENLAKLWPFAVLLVGFILSVYALSTRKKKDRPLMIFLGTFLLISSVLLFILSLGSYQYIKILWPGFLSALGLGFLSVYLSGDRKKAILAVSLFLIGVSVVIWIYYSLKSQYGLVIGVSLFIIGAGFLTRSLMKESLT